MTAKFPDFEKLQLTHQTLINKIVSKFAPYCDFSFVSLWSYNLKDEVDISSLNGNLVVKFIDCVTNKVFLSFFGSNKFIDTCKKLIEYANLNGYENHLKVIPEIFVPKNSNNKNIKLILDRDNFDYVYELTQISALEGKKYDTKRYLYRKFIKNNQLFRVETLDLKSKLTRKSIIKLFDQWKSIKNKSNEDVLNEISALKKLLVHSDRFNLFGVGIYINGNLSAFSLNEICQMKYAITHFAKTNYSFKGLNEALYKYTADYLMSSGCKYLNMEQDLGIKNLRYAKEIWQPVFYLKKFKAVKTTHG